MRRHSSKKGRGLKMLAVFAVAGLAAGLLMRKKPEDSREDTTQDDTIDKEFSDIAGGKESQVPGVDPLPPREPM